MTSSYTLSELASRLDGTVSGDGTIQITGLSAIDAAQPGTITWLSDSRMRHQLPECKACAIIVDQSFGETPMPSLRVESVDKAVCALLELFAPPQSLPEPGIHPTAVISESATIGKDVRIGPYVIIGEEVTIGDQTILHAGVHVGRGTTIGESCLLWDHAVVREYCVLGDRVIIQPNATIGACGFGYHFADGKHNKLIHIGRVIIGNDVEIGANTCIDRGKVSDTVIGPGTKIDNLVQVGHNAVLGSCCIVVSGCGIGGSTVLGNGVILAGKVGLRDHIHLHDGVRVAACACVAADVQAGETVSGIPAMDYKDHLRVIKATQEGPKSLKKLRELTKRIERLEEAAND